jgi:nucleotide-binding universal stress UspA family protein
MRILVAVDGSEHSKKAAEHVAELASVCSQLEITLYHVLAVPERLAKYGESASLGEEERLYELMDSKTEASIEEQRLQAESKILEPTERLIRQRAPHAVVDWKLSPVLHRDVGHTIMNEARNGSYGAIALGRRGQGRLADLAFGSVTSTVVHNTRDRAIWIVE